MSNDLNNDRIPEPYDLPNKPLGEAIFELRWSLAHRADGRAQHDPGFRILLGRYYDRLRNDYPHVENLQVSQFPEDMTPHLVHHQFRPAKGGWPLTQIGPGILTVNDTEGYTWGSFRPRISKALRALFESYPIDIQQLIPIRAQLTYINGLLFDATKESLTHFLRDYLHVTIAIDQKLFEEQGRADKPFSLDFTVSFALDELPGVGLLRFSTGTKNQQPALIWQIVIRTSPNLDEVPKDPQALETWTDHAHAVVDKWFFTLARGKLLRTFEASHGHSNR